MNSLFRTILASLLSFFVLTTLASGPAAARYAAIVLEADSGQVLYEINADTRNYPASLTKMMTLYMLFEALESGRIKPGTKLSVSRRAAGMPASKLGLKRGETITAQEAILALITKSANDVAVVVAEALGGSEIKFARMMTKKARVLGMRRTSFRNASGLYNRGQLSTARDMATLARALIRDFPEYYDRFSARTFPYRGVTYRTHNRLLRTYEGADGLKTGYIRASGYNLAASAKRNGVRLIAVLFGGKTARARDHRVARLLDRGFAKLSNPIYLPQGGVVAQDVPPAPAKPTVLAASYLRRQADAARVAQAALSNGTDEDFAKRIWGVQVGAFYGYGRAKRMAEIAASRVPDMLADASVRITYIKGDRGKIYRSRLLGMTQDHARATCQRLAALETDCLVVRDRGVRLAQSAE